MGLALVYHPDYLIRLPDSHRFPISKFARLLEILIEDGLAAADDVHRPEPAPPEWIELGHDPAYVTDVLERALAPDAVRRIGLPLTDAMVRRTKVAVGGTVLTARLALERGIAFNTAGGSHHAFPAYGSGFCIFNDLAITARVLQGEGRVERVLIVDLDVHQGDGTAEIFGHDPSVFTFSIHCDDNFPTVKRRSDLDVGLPAGTGDRAYLAALKSRLGTLVAEFEPDLVLYNAGVDPHRDDLLGKLALTDQGLSARDRHVLEACLAARVPVACTVGGGYADDVDALARRHAILHHAAIAALETFEG